MLAQQNLEQVTAGDSETGMCNSENIHWNKGHDNNFSISVDTIRSFRSIFFVLFFPPTYLYTVLNSHLSNNKNGSYLHEDDLASALLELMSMHSSLILAPLYENYCLHTS